MYIIDEVIVNDVNEIVVLLEYGVNEFKRIFLSMIDLDLIKVLVIKEVKVRFECKFY